MGQSGAIQENDLSCGVYEYVNQLRHGSLRSQVGSNAAAFILRNESNPSRGQGSTTLLPNAFFSAGLFSLVQEHMLAHPRDVPLPTGCGRSARRSREGRRTSVPTPYSFDLRTALSVLPVMSRAPRW